MLAPIIDITGLTRCYQQGQSSIEVLKDLELSIAPKETVAIIGKSGSGKSTLLSLMAGLDHPDAGDVKIAGQNINSMNETALAKFRSQNLSIIFQQFHLFKHFTALENVMVPLWVKGLADEAKAMKVLKEVGLADRMHHYPAQLSGGEKQRVAIARALVNEPLLLLADEPSGNLDEETGKQILQLLFNLVQQHGTSLVLVTHDESAAAMCHYRYRLFKGQLNQEH